MLVRQLFATTTWLVLLAAICCDAWIQQLPARATRQQQQQQQRPLSSLSTLYSLSSDSKDKEELAPAPASAVRSSQMEKLLREKLAEQTSAPVKDEEKYAVADGALLEKLAVEPTDTETTTSETTSELAKTMARMTKPRAYPLFLLEIATQIIESTVQDVMEKIREFTSDAEHTGGFAASPQSTQKKERIVILGTGWGSVAFLKDIDTDLYDVTVISPRNHFVFTPMLSGASVGTVEFRSICEPIREINRNAQYLEATATEIDPQAQTVNCESVVCDGNSCDIKDFTVEYDRLIYAVGAQTNTFGIPGVRERCCFLKQVEDARRIRTAIVNCFERASLPILSDEQRKADLTFCVIGAGPTGIEFAAELRDFIQEDGPKYYPNLLRYVRIKVIEASSTILAPFDKSLQAEAVRQMMSKVSIKDVEVAKLLPEDFKLTELLLDSSVKEVGEDHITLNDDTKIAYGLAVWAAGNGPLPLTLDLVKKMGPEQETDQEVARGRVAIDPWMRVVGGEGKILSFGDCSCITEGQLPATAQVASQQGKKQDSVLFECHVYCSSRRISPILFSDGNQANTWLVFLTVSTNSLQSDQKGFFRLQRKCQSRQKQPLRIRYQVLPSITLNMPNPFNSSIWVSWRIRVREVPWPKYHPLLTHLRSRARERLEMPYGGPST